jgi:hypothetical protein
MNKTELSINEAVKIGIIVGFVALLTLLHYQTTPVAGIRHVIFRELYFLPIIWGGSGSACEAA